MPSKIPRTRFRAIAASLALLTLSACNRDLWFFTYTTLGVEIQAEGQMPTALRLAYKRFEGAIIPVDTANQGTEKLLLSADPGLVAELDTGTMPSRLKTDLATLGHTLSSNATLVTDEAGKEWTIVDGDHSYAIRKEKSDLNVYHVQGGAKAHSVLATINAEQSFMRVTVDQVFATGKAAEIAAQREEAAARQGKAGPISTAMSAAKEVVK